MRDRALMLRVFLMELICYRYRMPKFASKNAAGTKAFARRTIQTFIASGRRPLTIALSGELGSGKTTFVQGLARALGVRQRPQSPTFVLVKWYRLGSPRSGFRRFIHVDAYRLRGVGEARAVGLAHTLRDRDAIVVIEWAERIKKLIPQGATWIHFAHMKKNVRAISFDVIGPKVERRRTKASRL